MKKNLIALALAALPVASMADVVLYGKIAGGVEFSKYQHTKGSQTNIVDYGSSIGFKGEEQLNGNLKAIWQLEQKVDIAGGATSSNEGSKGGINGFGTRDSFIGLKGDNIGTVKAGYLSTPVKKLNGKLDQWDYSSDAAGLGQFTRGTAGSDRYVAVQYETPNFNGFSGSVYVSPSDNNNSPVRVDANSKVRRSLQTQDSTVYGLSASYAQENGWFADVAGTYVKKTVNVVDATTGLPTGKTKDGYQALVQAGYDSDKWLAGLAYQRTSRVEGINDVAIKGNEVALSGAYSVDDALRLKATLAYGFGFKADDVAGTKVWGNGKYYQGILGADYALSKRTVANAQVGFINYGNSVYRSGTKDANNGTFGGRFGTVSVGMSHKF